MKKNQLATRLVAEKLIEGLAVLKYPIIVIYFDLRFKQQKCKIPTRSETNLESKSRFPGHKVRLLVNYA